MCWNCYEKHKEFAKISSNCAKKNEKNACFGIWRWRRRGFDYILSKRTSIVRSCEQLTDSATLDLGFCYHLASSETTLNHTLSIWLEIDFTSDIFLNISLRWLFRKIFKKTNKLNQYLYNRITQEIYFGRHFLSFVGFGIFCMSKKRPFWFTSRKSTLLH